MASSSALHRQSQIISHIPAMPHLTSAALSIPDYAQCTPNRIRIIHVGAGASGLLFTHKTRKHLSPETYELVCYDKNDTIGGTWYENRYPGCACDIPAHTYVFPFEPNPEWSGYYSYSAEIQDYMVKFCEKYDLMPFITLNSEVVGALWNEQEAKWHVDLKRSDGTEFKDVCDVLVNGTGVINRWKWPAIDGLHDFKGTLVHSAKWDQSLDWSGKRVGVIGTGSSSIQMVPHIAETAAHLKVFMRNNTYIGPQFGANVSNKEADPDAMEPDAAGKHQYTEKEKQRFRDDPEYHLKYRSAVEQSVIGGFKMFYRGSEMNILAKKIMQDLMAERLGKNEDLKKRLIPDWSPGCRRLTPGEGYLETFSRDNVTPVHDAISRVTSAGIQTADGTLHEFDIIACATGFFVQFLPHFRIMGTGGQVMQDLPEPNVYASVAAPGFPNYFTVNGPRGNWGQGCVLASHEVQIEYILQCVKKMQEDGIKSMVPRENVTTQLNAYMDAWHLKHSVWAEDCRSWYKDNKREGRVYIWPGSLLHHMKFMKRPRYEHYEIRYRDDGNIFAFLGNGLTIGEEKYGGNVPVPYIRNSEDEVWDIE